jgi:hypothetical protein
LSGSPVPEMVAAARQATDYLGFGNTQFDVAFADHLPFPAGTFDALVRRFGAMFFPSPVDRSSRDVDSTQATTEAGLGGVGGFAEGNPFSTRWSESSNGVWIRHHLRPILRTHSVLPTQASYAMFLARPARWFYPNPCCNSQYKRRSQWKTFGHCDARCLRSFVRRSLCFPGRS